MDYNDNDYQSHLAGEDGSKASSVLHSYALPKFDFDDSLQGHLRFDSLVENEVFLGIPSQEDNQWIEDFSRASSGIEFSSSAAESCSIPRRHNVWSEATSTESVEMLLKSVGQEEMVPGDTIIEGSDTGNELACLTHPVESSLKLDDKRDDVKESSSAAPIDEPDEFTGTFSRGERSQSQDIYMAYAPETQVVETQEVEMQEAEPIVDGSSNIAGERCSGVKTGEKLETEIKSVDENFGEGKTSLNESIPEKSDGLSSIPVIQSAIDKCLTDSLPVSVEKMDSQLNLIECHREDTSGLPSEHHKPEEEHFFVSKESSVGYEKFHGSAAKSETCTSSAISLSLAASELKVAKELKFEEPCEQGNQGSLTTDGCKEDTSSFEPPETSRSVEVFSKGLEDEPQTEGNSILCEDKKACVTQRCLETTDPKDQENGTNAEMENVTILHVSDGLNALAHKEGNFLGSCSPPNLSTSEAFTSLEISEPLKQNSPEGPSIIQEVPVSDELALERPVPENLETGNVSDKMSKEDACAGDHVSLSVPAESMDICAESCSSMAYVDATNEDVSDVKEKEDVQPVEKEMGSSRELDHGVKSSSAGEEHEQISAQDEGSKLESSTLNKQASTSGTGAIATGIVDHDEKLKPVSVMGGSVLSAENEEMIVLGTEAEVSTSKEPSEVVGQLGSSSADGKDGSGDTHMEMTPLMVDRNLATQGNPDTASHIEQAAIAEAISESSRHVEVCAISSGSTKKEGLTFDRKDASGVETAGLEKNQETIVETMKLVKYGVEGRSDVIDGLKSGSAAVISCTALSPSEKKMIESRSRPVVENAVPLVDKLEISGKPLSTSLSSGENTSTKADGSFTFDATPLAGSFKGEADNSITSAQACQMTEHKLHLNPGDGVYLTSGSKQANTKNAQEISQVTPHIPDKGTLSGGAKGERKARRSSVKSGKENAKKGNQVKEISSSKQSDRGDKSGVPFSPTVAVQKMRYEPGSVDCNIGKSGGVVSYPTSSLPDLNTSSPVSTLFHQPFTDLQQVQLRAQIFVYGSLIQGAVPDKACMASAFGTSDSAADGGRSVWDPAWRACDDRISGQRSHTGNNETPLPSRSGPRTPDQASKQVVHQNKVTSSASGRAGGKGTNSPVVSPMIPLSSPLWNMSTPSCDGLPSNGMARGAVIDYKTLTPMHPYQTPPVRNFVGHTASWLPQSPFPGPWVASPQMSAAQRPALPVTEPVKLTPVKEASLSISTGAKHEPPDSVIHAGDSGIVAGASSHECKKASVSRKRKKASGNVDRAQISLLGTSSESVPAHAIGTQLSSKAPISDDLGRSLSVVAPLVAQSQTGSVAAPVVSGHFSTSVVITPPPTSVPKSNSDILITSTPSSTDLSKKALDIGKMTVISEDLSKVEESRLRAEEAAADAAAAVGHCQDVWNQLDKHKNSDLVSDLEVKLSSAAVAVAAAASVAKAAAAAAKIASNAALQAKLMADKALVAYVPSNPSQTNATSFPMNNLGSSTPASILKGWDVGNASGSVIFAAREAARRRIEAASAASKHAENLDAIVRAAELAADAVSHAGKIVAIADPLPLSQLVEAGPDGYWKVSQAPSAQGVQEKRVNGGESDISVVGKGPGTLSKRSEGPSDEKTHPMTPTCQPGGVSGNMKEDNVRNDVISTPITGVENDVREAKRHCTPEASKTLSQIAESEDDSGLASPVLETCGNVASSKMREGSLVEVLKDSDDGKRAWYSAKVLALKNGKALVCYTDHQSDEGIKQLKDWVPLDEGSDESPRIRTPHHVTALQGAKKRRRAAVKEYTWYVGDRVDAWIDNRWREGVIAEKNKRDETTFSVNFPDYGDTAVVRAWHLRPTLIWKDGEWVEWSSSRHDFMSQGDTPKEKRVKLGNPASEDMRNDGLSKRVIDEPVDMLPLAVNEKTFNIGSSKNDKKPNTLRTMRSGLQKEGSKVFGVPKPGKKRKFMEVSKHYVSDKASKSDASHDTARFTKYLMPQATGAGGWKNSSRIDSKEKQVNEAKRRPPKPNKPPGTTRNLKDNNSTSTGDATVAENVVGDGIKFDKSEPRQPNVVNFDEGAEGPMEFSSGAFPSNIPKKASTSSNRKEQLKKRTPLSTSLKSSKVEVKDKSTPEVNEPRRSNRKIQPTSRLLEGIQSSLIISKFPSVSHDKGSRSHSRGASR